MTTPPLSTAMRTGAGALIAQILLQVFWHAWLVPASRPALALAVLPLLPALWVGIDNLRRGVLIGGIVSLFYFCHGIVELFDGAARVPAAIEILLSVTVIAALGWDTRQRKRAVKQ